MSASVLEGIEKALERPRYVAASSRILLRREAAAVTKLHDPSDMAGALDSCKVRLDTPFPVPEIPEVIVVGSISLSMSRDDESAVNRLLEKQRLQAIEDVAQRQRAAALRGLLSDPSVALAWWLDPQTGALGKPPSPEQVKGLIEQVKGMTKIFDDLPPSTDTPVDMQLLGILRSFVASFPHEHQKRMLMAIMISTFAQTNQPHLVAKVEQLMAGEW
ncbi:hypothetical protein ACQPZZ_01885 [Microbispora sp. CA-135349]|uniref:hypothetical protein n=1 Tax=Microbispora sp. CA-135349 TaxID=3239953 RepID=UPI003D8E516D